MLADPEHVPSCDVGVLVGCSVNLDSWQGSVFGFPNPFIGIMAWPVVIAIGVAILAGAQFARWFWIGFNVGVDRRARLRRLAHRAEHLRARRALPVVHAHVGGDHPDVLGGDPAQPAAGTYSRVGTRAGASPREWYKWIPLITVVCYAIVVLLAQAYMNAIPRVLIDLQNLFR